MRKINIGIIGCGHWGQNYVRVFSELNVKLLKVFDANRAKLEHVRFHYPGVKIAVALDDIIKDKELEAVVVSTPAYTHYGLCKKILQNQKHVLVEKPFVTQGGEGEELVKLAEEKHRIIMVSHTFLFNPAVVKLKEYMKKGSFGKIYYLHSRRTHLGLIREDVNAVWDLAPHDISMFSFLLDSVPLYASAVGRQILHKGKEDVAFITLKYPGGIIGNIHVSWIDSNKVRELVVIGSKKRIVFDDLNSLEKIKIFEKGISVERDVDSYGEFQLLLRDGDILSPKLEMSEPLKNECQHFLLCLEKNKTPLTDGRNGLLVVRTIEAIQQSIAKLGQPVRIRSIG